LPYTLQDFVALNPYYKKRYDPNTGTAYVSNTQTGKEISFKGGQGQQYGLGGLQDDSHIISDPAKFISALSAPASSAPARTKYESPYSDKIGQTLAAIQGRKSFRYRPESDKGLQAAQENTMDAVSRAAARRGMLYSDSNKSQMGKSALALVPQFEERAFSRYQQEGQSLQDQINMLLGLENQSYGRYRDTVGDTRYEDTLSYSRGRDVIGDERTARLDTRQTVLDELARQKLEASPEMDPRYKELSLRKLERDANQPYSTGTSGGLTPYQQYQVTQQEKEELTADKAALQQQLKGGKLTREDAIATIQQQYRAGMITLTYANELLRAIDIFAPATAAPANNNPQVAGTDTSAMDEIWRSGI
jgi:hypothetical protein